MALHEFTVVVWAVHPVVPYRVAADHDLHTTVLHSRCPPARHALYFSPSSCLYTSRLKKEWPSEGLTIGWLRIVNSITDVWHFLPQMRTKNEEELGR